MLGLNSGLLGVRRVPTTASASGLWDSNEQVLAKRASIWPFGPNEAPNIGESFQGGFFAGYISHTANSVATHALIVGPRATAATGTNYPVATDLQWKTTNTSTAGVSSQFNGRANTDALIALGIATFPAAQFCVNLTVGGFTDWYLPARYELEIAYYNLKPTTTANDTTYGGNPYSVPARASAYTSGTPAMASGTAAAFNSTGDQRFTAVAGRYHYTSTSSYFNYVWAVGFAEGYQRQDAYEVNLAIGQTRAFRRIAL